MSSSTMPKTELQQTTLRYTTLWYTTNHTQLYEPILNFTSYIHLHPLTVEYNEINWTTTDCTELHEYHPTENDAKLVWVICLHSFLIYPPAAKYAKLESFTSTLSYVYPSKLYRNKLHPIIPTYLQLHHPRVLNIHSPLSTPHLTELKQTALKYTY